MHRRGGSLPPIRTPVRSCFLASLARAFRDAFRGCFPGHPPFVSWTTTDFGLLSGTPAFRLLDDDRLWADFGTDFGGLWDTQHRQERDLETTNIGRKDQRGTLGGGFGRDSGKGLWDTQHRQKRKDQSVVGVLSGMLSGTPAFRLLDYDGLWTDLGTSNIGRKDQSGCWRPCNFSSNFFGVVWGARRPPGVAAAPCGLFSVCPDGTESGCAGSTRLPLDRKPVLAMPVWNSLSD